MRSPQALFSASLAGVLLAGCGSAPLAPGALGEGVSAAGRSGPVAIAMYVGMDDYRGKTLPGLQALHQDLARVGSGPALRLTLSGDVDDRGDGFRTQVQRGQAWGQGFERLGELNTGHTPALRDYLAWASKPAHQAMHVVIGTHGGAHAGLLWDYDGAGNPSGASSHMSLKKAFKALGKGYPGGRIDSVTFDACMMASIEVGEALKGTVKVMSGSEDFSMGGSAPWGDIAAEVAAGKAGDAEGFTKLVSRAVIRQGKWGEKGSATWSAVRLNADFDRLVRSTDKLASALLTALPGEGEAIRKAVGETRNFAIMGRYAAEYGDYYQRDMVDLCRALGRNVASPAVKAAAKRVEADLAKTLVALENMPSEDMAHGLAVFLPHGLTPAKAEARLKGYRQTAFARHTRWDEFLTALNH